MSTYMTDESLLLGDLPVRTVSARVRPLIPQIERELGRGVAMTTILDALKERGVTITASNLAKVLYRARKRRRDEFTEAVPPSPSTYAGPSAAHPSKIPAAPIAAELPPPLPIRTIEASRPQPANSTNDPSAPPPGFDPETWARMDIIQRSKAKAEAFMREHDSRPRRSLLARPPAAGERP